MARPADDRQLRRAGFDASRSRGPARIPYRRGPVLVPHSGTRPEPEPRSIELEMPRPKAPRAIETEIARPRRRNYGFLGHDTIEEQQNLVYKLAERQSGLDEGALGRQEIPVPERPLPIEEHIARTGPVRFGQFADPEMRISQVSEPGIPTYLRRPEKEDPPKPGVPYFLQRPEEPTTPTPTERPIDRALLRKREAGAIEGLRANQYQAPESWIGKGPGGLMTQGQLEQDLGYAVPVMEARESAIERQIAMDEARRGDPLRRQIEGSALEAQYEELQPETRGESIYREGGVYMNKPAPPRMGQVRAIDAATAKRQMQDNILTGLRDLADQLERSGLPEEAKKERYRQAEMRALISLQTLGGGDFSRFVQRPDSLTGSYPGGG